MSFRDFPFEFDKINWNLTKSLKRGKRSAAKVSLKIEISDELKRFLATKFGLRGRSFTKIADFFQDIPFTHSRYYDEYKYFVKIRNKIIEARLGTWRKFKYFDENKNQRVLNFEQSYLSIRYCRECIYEKPNGSWYSGNYFFSFSTPKFIQGINIKLEIVSCNSSRRIKFIDKIAYFLKNI